MIRLEARDRAAVMRVRQDVLAGASAWGGVRVGEQTGDVGESALEFTLPGPNLDIAIGAIGDVGATVVSTEIDVEASQIERTTTSRPADDGVGDGGPDPGDGQVRLRVEVSEESPAGAEALLRGPMAVFSIVGVVATLRWLRDLVGSRRPGRRRGDRGHGEGPPRRSIDRVDLRDDPPTQETPRIPPTW